MALLEEKGAFVLWFSPLLFLVQSALAAPELSVPMLVPGEKKICAGNDLFAAIRSRDLDCLALSLGHMDVNDRDADGNPPLHYAVRLHNAAAIRLLLKNGADLHQRDFASLRPRELAEQLGYNRLARYFQEMERETERLWDAVDRNDLVAASDSLQRGASWGTRDLRLDTLLHKAAQSDFSEMGKLLLHYGARLESRNYLGETPLHAAALRDHFDFMKMLLAAGANPNAVNERRETPLDLAEIREDPRILALLKRARARKGSGASVEFDFTGMEPAAANEGGPGNAFRN
jgi:ankyrin repeat protein